MIAGEVNASREAVLRLTVQGPSGQARDIEAVIDTGYSGMLTLPPPMVAELGLSFRSSGRAILANGTEDAFSTYDATVLWDGALRQVEADALGPTPLAGMALLEGYELCLNVIEGGRVSIEAAG